MRWYSSEAKPLETTPAAAEAKKGAMLVVGGALEVTSSNSRDPEVPGAGGLYITSLTRTQWVAGIIDRILQGKARQSMEDVPISPDW